MAYADDVGMLCRRHQTLLIAVQMMIVHASLWVLLAMV